MLEELAAPDLPAIQTVAVKLPNFWPVDTQLWFNQVEGQFIAWRITSQLTIYGHVISVLPPEIATEVRDLIINRPATNPYDQLKKAIRARTDESRIIKMKQVLTTGELGDRRPSQLLRTMEQLSEGSNVHAQPLFQELFLCRLPAHVRAILATAGEAMSLSKQAAMADIMKASGGIAWSTG
ncbi:Uncharacterised protein r2_g254 [Pycnogonum litorale]